MGYVDSLEPDRLDPLSAAEDWAAATLGHRFTRPDLLTEALTHSTAGRPDYQRLEFLGDRVLGCAVAAWLFEASDEGEGSLARRLAGLVDRDSCAAVGRAFGVEAHVRMDKGAMNAGVHRSDNALADVTEALIGAVFEDAGFAVAAAFVRRAWADRFDARAAAPHDAKSRLQEWAQARGRRLPQYEVVAREGPDHAPRFRVRVGVAGEPPVDAMGASKQEAERNAAAALLDRVAP